MALYYVKTDRGAGIRKARDIRQARGQVNREVGADNVQEVRRATPEDIAWVKGMGGHVPKE